MNLTLILLILLIVLAIYVSIKGLSGLRNLIKMFIPVKSSVESYHKNIEQATHENINYRKVEYTTPHMQLVLMNIPEGQEIGTETHDNTTQFIRVEEGTGRAVINKKEYSMKSGDAFVVPPGTEHNFVSITPLKLYTIYSPPEHADDTVELHKPN